MSTPESKLTDPPLEEFTITARANRFSISGFVSRISEKGLARTNRFRVIFTTPISFGDAQQYRQVSLNCESAELPGRDLVTADARIYGPTFKSPYMSNYNDISFTFLCDASLVEKRVFDEWMSVINPRTSFDFEYRENYLSRVVIEQLSDDETTTYSCELIDAFPIQINSMPVNWGDDNFHRVTVTMTYRYWVETGALDNIEQIPEETDRLTAPPTIESNLVEPYYSGGPKTRKATGITSKVPAKTGLAEWFKGLGGRFAGGGASYSGKTW